jgi:hypothetical protein
MNKIIRSIHLYNTLNSLGFDYWTDPLGFIIVDGGGWEISCPDDDEMVVEVTFGKGVSAGDAGIVINRLSWPLQSMGFRLVVNRGYFDPRTRV